MPRYVPVMLALAVCALGCGQETAEVATEPPTQTPAAADEQNVDDDHDSDGDTVRIESADGEVTYEADSATNSVEVTSAQGTMVAGEKAELPADFPKDIPLYDNFKPDMVTNVAQNDVFNISGPVNATLDEIKTFYNERAPAEGWTETMAMTQGQMVMLHYKKDARVFHVTVTAGEPARIAITTSETN